MIKHSMKTHSPKIILSTLILGFLLLGCGTRSPKSQGSEPIAEAPAAVIISGEKGANEKKTLGINGFEGEVRGTPVAGSKFQSLQIGMTVKQVTDILGRASWRGTYGTPFGGGDRTAFQLRYRNQGDLVFTGGKLFDSAPGNLVIINQNAKEYAFGNW